MGYVDGLSLYEYVRNAPVGNLDPLGLAATTQPAKAAAPEVVVNPMAEWIVLQMELFGKENRIKPPAADCKLESVKVVITSLEWLSDDKAVSPAQEGAILYNGTNIDRKSGKAEPDAFSSGNSLPKRYVNQHAKVSGFIEATYACECRPNVTEKLPFKDLETIHVPRDVDRELLDKMKKDLSGWQQKQDGKLVVPMIGYR
jgi:hypothetical protein